jgi:photosystem II stability/assembly factor-like uncharacterized protein
MQAQEENEKKDKDPLNSATFNGLKLRAIGPAIASGRVSDFAVNPDKPWEYYVAVASGNVWKTENAGITFKPIFEKEGSYSIGCVAMDPNNPYIIWVGTGENNSQRSVSYGDGVYKSEDGGKNWKNMGLKKSEHVGKIIIDPRDSKHVYVAAQGPLWGPGGDRGLYKTLDAGKTWKAILTISENTGVTDIVMDPRNPDVLYAASYQRRRHVWTLLNGGPESAIYKSTDAGKTWDKLKSGLPKGDVGRIGLAMSPADPDVLYAIIEAAAKASGVYRSTNRGATWEKRNDYISTSPQYYQELVCDPLDVDRVYSLDTWMMVSDDGAKSFKRVGNNSRHVDDHALWIDPYNTSHLLVGGDGGIYESFDRGVNWDFKANLPITQFYRVAVDNAQPFYNVYGGTQDNNTLGGPSRTISRTGIVNSDWFVTKGGDGFETQVDPENPDIVYSQSQYGWLVRYDKKSGESMGIKPMEDVGEPALRWNWDSPLLISPHSAQRLYFAANKLFRSDDRGNTWKAISPDLTRQIDRNKLPVMGKVWSVDAVSKNRSTSFYGNIVSLTESPLQEDLIYVGTDDGLIQVTEDGGNNWRKIEKFSGVPNMTYVSYLVASQHDANTVFAAFDNHKMADFTPYLFKSKDRGKSWQSIRGTLPDRGSVYAIAEDHVNPKLLFAGTEFGVFFTIDGGNKWTQLKGEIPTIAIKDITIQKRENDLVLATFGRGFYILDDYTPLRILTKDILNSEAYVFPVKDALMYIPTRTGTGSQGSSFYAAENPPFGATFAYYLKEKIKTKKMIRQEEEKKLIKAGKAVPYPSFDELRAEDEERDPFLLFTIKDESGQIVRRIKSKADKGINRVTWDLRYPATTPTQIEESERGRSRSRSETGILALPGNYSVIMAKSVNGVITQLSDPVTFSATVLGTTILPAQDRAALLTFQNKIGELRRAVLGAVEATQELKNRIKYIKKALQNTPAASMSLVNDVNAIEAQSNDIMRALTGDRTISSRSEPTPPSIRDRVQIIVWDQWRSTSAPTQTQHDAYRIAGEEFAPQLAQLKQLVEVDLKNIENTLESARAPWTPGRIPEWRME